MAASVRVLDAALMQRRNAQHLEDVLHNAPNVNFAAGASRARYVQLRGIGETGQFVEPLNPSVGLLIDGIDFSGLGAAAMLYDMAQVEVLQGPHPVHIGGQRVVELNGEYRYPKWRGTVALDWTSDDFDAALWASYTGSYYDDFRFDPAAIATTARVASWTTLNASWGWNLNETHRVSLQVKNLTDRDPPRALGASAWVDTYNHDAMGRFVTLNWIGRF